MDLDGDAHDLISSPGVGIVTSRVDNQEGDDDGRISICVCVCVLDTPTMLMLFRKCTDMMMPMHEEEDVLGLTGEETSAQVRPLLYKANQHAKAGESYSVYSGCV